MEIKKGISQMAEYPNVEINYVIPEDGRMYYVLKDGILENGCIIATTDPKYAIDESNPANGIGVFSEDGKKLIDFDKKSIKYLSDDLVLVVNSKPNTPEVVGIIGKENDPTISKTVNEAQYNIVSKMMLDMGVDGEMIFSDPYSEANVYKLDEYNNKLGDDSSFIGKNNEGLFFHTNDVNSDTKYVKINSDSIDEISESVSENIESKTNENEGAISPTDAKIEENPQEEVKIDINNGGLNGFSISDEDLEKINDGQDNLVSPEEVSQSTEEINPQELVEETPTMDVDVVDHTDIDNNDDDKILDNAIEVIDKMIKETNKLKEKNEELEEQLKEKNKIIQEAENKKDELNEILGKANAMLEGMD